MDSGQGRGGLFGRPLTCGGLAALFASLFLLGLSACVEDVIRRTDRVAKVPPPYSPLRSGHVEPDEGQLTTHFQVSGNPMDARITPLKDVREGDSTIHVARSMTEFKLDLRADQVAAAGLTLHWGWPDRSKENRTVAAPLEGEDLLWGSGVHVNLGREWARGGVAAEIGLALYLLPYTSYENGRSTGSDSEGLLLPYASGAGHVDLGTFYPFAGVTVQMSPRNDGIDHDCVDDWEVEGNECAAPEIDEKLVPPVIFGGVEYRLGDDWSLLGSLQYPINDSQLRIGPLVSLGVRARVSN